MTGRLQNVPVLKAGLSERELLSVVAAFLSIKGESPLDWDKFIQLAGYSSVQSARICFRPVQKKLKAFMENGGGLTDGGLETTADGNDDGGARDALASPNVGVMGTPKTPKTPKTPRTPKTPSSRPRGRPKKRKMDEAGLEELSQASSAAGVMPESPVSNMGNGVVENHAVKMEQHGYMENNTGLGIHGMDDGQDVFLTHETAFVSCMEQHDDPVEFKTDHYTELDVVTLEDD